jgi:hypothetical protein
MNQWLEYYNEQFWEWKKARDERKRGKQPSPRPVKRPIPTTSSIARHMPVVNPPGRITRDPCGYRAEVRTGGEWRAIDKECEKLWLSKPASQCAVMTEDLANQLLDKYYVKLEGIEAKRIAAIPVVVSVR